MDRRQAIALLALSAPALAQPAAQNSVVGSWRLKASERTYSDGRKEYHFGKNPVGRTTYDKQGRMNAFASTPDRKTSLGPGMDLDTAPEAELRGIVTGLTAYFGTYTVDQANQVITHHVIEHINPSSSGTDMKRNFHFEGADLILTRHAPDGSSSDRMVFEREPD